MSLNAFKDAILIAPSIINPVASNDDFTPISPLDQFQLKLNCLFGRAVKSIILGEGSIPKQ